MGIEPKLIDELSKEIGNRFGFLELDIIIYQCVGQREINGIASDSDPRWEIALKCIQRMEQLGLARDFLAYIVNSLPNDRVLHDLVARALPEALQVLPTIKANVDKVLSALDVAKGKIPDPALKQAVLESRTALRLVIDSLELLDGYKSLHDNLHRIQLRQYSKLLVSARKMEKDRAEIEPLRQYQDSVRAAVATSSFVLESMPDDPRLKAAERDWIDLLDRSVTKYQSAIDARDRKQTVAEIYVFWRELERNLPRLNKLIVEAAKQLPLEDFSKALLKMSEVIPESAEKMAQANASLRELRAALRGRVAEHDVWQEADDKFWALDKSFEHSVESDIEGFRDLWEATKSAVQALAAMNPESTWSKSIFAYARGIDDGLKDIDIADDTTTDANVRAELKTNLMQSYFDFRGEARNRFLVVDQILKSECGLLVRIAEPLRSILRETGDG